ncbi:MAG: response regulator [Bacteroidales bacterium]|nr:response regulator [Bacteroidales bacterium]
MNKDINEIRIKEIIDALIKAAAGDYNCQISLSGKSDELDAIAMGVNMLIDEVKMRDEDITKQHVIDFETKQELEQVFQNAFIGMHIIDSQCNILKANQALADMVHLPLNEIVGKKCHDIFPSEECNTKECPIHVLLSGNDYPDRESERILHDGTQIFYDVSIAPIKGDSGAISGFVKCYKEVTKLKKTEISLKESHKELLIRNRIVRAFLMESDEHLFDKVMSIICTAFKSKFGLFGYIDESGDLVVPSLSRQIMKQCQMKDKTLVFTPDMWGDSTWGTALREKRVVYSNKHSEKPPHGHIRIFNNIAHPIMHQNELIGLLMVANKKTDYTKKDLKLFRNIANLISPILINRLQKLRQEAFRIQAEKDLVAALEKAKESDHLKSAFLSTMSHELRTPLNSIIGFSQLVDHDTSIEDIVEYNQMILTSGNDLLEIINNIMNATAITGGDLPIKKEIYFLNLIMQNLYESTKINIKDNLKEQISLLFKPAEPGKGPTVEIDLDIFQRIMDILLKNAVKFTEKGCIELGYVLKDQENILFYVKDSGIGIPDDKQEIIFDLFRQLDDSDSRQYGGMGLGLYLARKLTEYLGGKIWLESLRGKGSTFYVSLPCLKIKETQAAIEPIEPKYKKIDLKGKTILVAEDNDLNFMVIEKMLGIHGAKLLWAKNGLEAVELCEKHPDIDMVLMDIIMPEMDGMAATQLIKKNKPQLTIVAITAYNMPSDLVKILESGVDDYLSKPVHRVDLYEMIGKYI